jgi:hypothetical protein
MINIIVPVRNEAENFTALKGELCGRLGECHLMAVHDQDEDPTPYKPYDVKNLGVGVLGALKTGLAVPSAASIVMMADGSDDVRQVTQMTAAFRTGADVVAASRYMPGGEQRGGPFMKGLLSRLAGLSLRALGFPTADPTNNFKLYSRRLLDAVTIESTGGFELALELTSKAHRMGMKVVELPTIWRDRTVGESKFKLLKWLPHYLRWYWYAL